MLFVSYIKLNLSKYFLSLSFLLEGEKKERGKVMDIREICLRTHLGLEQIYCVVENRLINVFIRFFYCTKLI